MSETKTSSASRKDSPRFRMVGDNGNTSMTDMRKPTTKIAHLSILFPALRHQV
ncbi:hypothetical protein M404DRAFT_994552 [Pisolithus tinctorius Marx 270]|uniref:Uncharacterized protein n=1 Tax=Pisolithus tinctorius Marx 270 TaxID=870435 RepID=A0A0C3KQU2_PISTI|nr:hypothetical protein M404DRAFT_994552 [Pisolithus tinctorius Marx 270]